MTDDVTELALAQLAAVFDADWPALERFYAPDVHYLDPAGKLAGRGEAVRHLREQVDALPDCGHDVRRTYSNGADGVVVEWRLLVPRDNPSMSLDVITAYDVLDGRIVSERNYWDNAALTAQLGPSQTTTAPR
jgi:ketosteroid isomerase-like protein